MKKLVDNGLWIGQTPVMTTEQQRIKIAEACGWTGIANYGDGIVKGFPEGLPTPYNCHRSDVPDYLNDLNAMHEAEKVLIAQGLTEDYTDHLERICYIERAEISFESYQEGVGWGHNEWFHATAAQRAEAFLRTLNIWKD